MPATRRRSARAQAPTITALVVAVAVLLTAVPGSFRQSSRGDNGDENGRRSGSLPGGVVAGFADAQGLVVSDWCSDQTPTSGYDQLTGRPALIEFAWQGYAGGTEFVATDPDTVRVTAAAQRVATLNDATIVIRYTNVAIVTPLLPALFRSGTVDLTMGVSPYLVDTDDLLDLTQLYIDHRLEERFPPQLVAQVTIGGRRYGIPDKYVPWGIWYRKSAFDALGLVPPATYVEFLAVCEAIRVSKLVTYALAFNSADFWGGLSWTTENILRLGGAYLYEQLATGAIAYDTHPIVREAYQKVDDLFALGYFPPKALTATVTFVSELIDVAVGSGATGYGGDANCAMMLSTPVGEIAPLLFGLPESDYGYFPYPTMETAYPEYAQPDTSELTTTTSYFASRWTKSPNATAAFLLYAASPEFYGDVNASVAAGGALPAQLAFRNAVSNPEVAALYAHLAAASTAVPTLDARVPAFTALATPAIQAWTEGRITLDASLVLQEGARQETLLGRAAQPQLSLPDGTYAETQLVALSCSTANATIEYALADVTADGNAVDVYVAYTVPVSLASGHNWRLRVKATRQTVKPVLADSLVAQGNYQLAARTALVAGDVLTRRFDTNNAVFILATVTLPIAGWITYISLSSASFGRAEGFSRFWAAAATLVTTFGLWAAPGLAVTMLVFPDLAGTGLAGGPRVDLRLLATSWVPLLASVALAGRIAVPVWRRHMASEARRAVARNRAIDALGRDNVDDDDDDEDHWYGSDDGSSVGKSVTGDSSAGGGGGGGGGNTGGSANDTGGRVSGGGGTGASGGIANLRLRKPAASGTAPTPTSKTAAEKRKRRAWTVFTHASVFTRAQLRRYRALRVLSAAGHMAVEWARNVQLMLAALVFALGLAATHAMLLAAVTLPAAREFAALPVPAAIACAWFATHSALVLWMPRTAILPQLRTLLFVTLYAGAAASGFFVAALSWSWRWSAASVPYSLASSVWTAGDVHVYVALADAETALVYIVFVKIAFGGTFLPYEISRKSLKDEAQHAYVSQRMNRLMASYAEEKEARVAAERRATTLEDELAESRHETRVAIAFNPAHDDLVHQFRLLPQFQELFDATPGIIPPMPPPLAPGLVPAPAPAPATAPAPGRTVSGGGGGGGGSSTVAARLLAELNAAACQRLRFLGAMWREANVARSTGGNADTIDALMNWEVVAGLPSDTVERMKRKLRYARGWMQAFVVETDPLAPDEKESVRSSMYVNPRTALRVNMGREIPLACLAAWNALPPLAAGTLAALREKLPAVFDAVVRGLQSLAAGNNVATLRTIRWQGPTAWLLEREKRTREMAVAAAKHTKLLSAAANGSGGGGGSGGSGGDFSTGRGSRGGGGGVSSHGGDGESTDAPGSPGGGDGGSHAEDVMRFDSKMSRTEGATEPHSPGLGTRALTLKTPGSTLRAVRKIDASFDAGGASGAATAAAGGSSATSTAGGNRAKTFVVSHSSGGTTGGGGGGGGGSGWASNGGATSPSPRTQTLQPPGYVYAVETL